MINFGWLLPDGAVILTEQCSHIDVVADEPRLLALLPKRIAEQVEGLTSTFRYCNELADRGEHPEWHVYECAQADFCGAARVWEALLDVGCARIGRADTKHLHFECTPQTEQKLKARMEAVAFESRSHAVIERFRG